MASLGPPLPPGALGPGASTFPLRESPVDTLPSLPRGPLSTQLLQRELHAFLQCSLIALKEQALTSPQQTHIPPSSGGPPGVQRDLYLLGTEGCPWLSPRGRGHGGSLAGRALSARCLCGAQGVWAEPGSLRPQWGSDWLALGAASQRGLGG